MNSRIVPPDFDTCNLDPRLLDGVSAPPPSSFSPPPLPTPFTPPPPQGSLAATGGLLPSPVLTASTDTTTSPATTTTTQLSPRISHIDENGKVMSQSAYEAKLNKITRKDPLKAALSAVGVYFPLTATLAVLREKLVDHWYAVSRPPASSSPPRTPSSTRKPTKIHKRATTVSPEASSSNNIDDEISEAHLLKDITVNGAESGAEEILGYTGDALADDEGEDDEEYDEEEEKGMRDDPNESIDEDDFDAFKRQVRINAAVRTEQNRRKGGLKTQRSMVRAWEDFLLLYHPHKVKDDVVDEHSLLLFIQHSAERPQLDRRRQPIPGTLPGASQLKKLFFGVLRIRKVQEAENPSLKAMRPVGTVLVYDAIKTRMDEALERSRNGIIETGDAPDITANTFLANITDLQLEAIGLAFLGHRELRSTVNGHLAWTWQNASGNRGDDLRALKLCELQPYTWLHPNDETTVFSVVAIQGEEKAGKRGMKTTINPVYTTLIAHEDPLKCPLGAIAIYLHYLFDYFMLTEKTEIDWTMNKTWRQVRLLFGSVPTVPFNESNLYNLYVKAFAKAGFQSRIKAHLPRHILGYQQERKGVDSEQTAKLGWSRSIYIDTYAPSLAKSAILGAHGYKVHEVYDPVWRHIVVPVRFLNLMCPMADEIYNSINGKENLMGAANFWKLVLSLRPYLFQCAAAIHQVAPDSAIFRLPALADPAVQDWMKNIFPGQLATLKAQATNPVDLARLENAILRQALEENRALLHAQSMELAKVREMLVVLERRTSLFSPPKGYSTGRYMDSLNCSRQVFETTAPLFPVESLITRPAQPALPEFLQGSSVSLSPPQTPSRRPLAVLQTPPRSSPAGLTPNSGPNSPNSPIAPAAPARFLLPPAEAFNDPHATNLFWPPVLGLPNPTWDKIFDFIKQPHLLWDPYKPESLAFYTIDSLWKSYDVGLEDSNGQGLKPSEKSLMLCQVLPT